MSLVFDVVPEMSFNRQMVPEMSPVLTEVQEQMREKQLLPDRYPNGELFLCDLGDVTLKDDTASMEHPVFALSTKPDLGIRHYKHNGNEVQVVPSAKGLATIHDKDILIFAISQIMEAKNSGLAYSQEVTFNANDFLRFSNRMTNGRGYKGLRDALIRLRGTTIETNILTGGSEQAETFGLIDKSRVRKQLKDGTVTDWSVKLSDWLFNAIEANEVLTLHKDYFRLRKPLERRIYELARKHCGAQKSWKVSLEVLLKKSGSQASKKKFKQLLKPIVEFDHLPDYRMDIDDDDMITFTNRRIIEDIHRSARMIIIDNETYAAARRYAPEWDVYLIEEAWRSWMNQQKMPAPKNPNKAYLGFCRSWFEKRGRP